jgi:F0F1-type ATP synthase delta subunit
MEIAQETGQMEKFSTDMDVLKQIVDNVPDFIHFVTSRTIDIEIRKQTASEILKKYNISYVVSMDYIINEKLSGNAPLDIRLKFESIDCVYSDGFWSIHSNNKYFSE